MKVRQFPAFAQFGRRFFILISREKILVAQLFKLWITNSEMVDKVKIRVERREMVKRTSNQHSKEIIGLEFGDPGGKTEKLTVKHKDRGTQDLRLINGKPARIKVERCKEFSHRLKVHGSKFVLRIRHRIKFFERRRV